MIHVLTIHWKDDTWVDLQCSYFQRYLGKDNYISYAFLNDLPLKHKKKFFYSSTEAITDHSIKLNILADIACINSQNDSDILLFVDGDAFPIAPIKDFITHSLAVFPLVAVQRLENLGDIQPHPSFCFTTVGFWKKIQGDWNIGYSWKNSLGENVADVGGNLLEKLNDQNINWKKLKRSNVINYHPLWFGVYENMIYHHGAGFRERFSRVDASLRKHKHNRNIIKYSLRVFKKIFGFFIRKKSFVKNIQELSPEISAANELSERILDLIKKDVDFYKIFVGIKESSISS